MYKVVSWYLCVVSFYLVSFSDPGMISQERNTAIDNPTFVKESDIVSNENNNEKKDRKINSGKPTIVLKPHKTKDKDKDKEMKTEEVVIDMTINKDPSKAEPSQVDSIQTLPGHASAIDVPGQVSPSDDEEELELEGDNTPQALRKRLPRENVYSNKTVKKRIIPLANLSKVIIDKKQKGEFREEYKVRIKKH